MNDRLKKEACMERKTFWYSIGLLFICTTWLAACAGAPSSRAPSSRAPSTTDLLLQAGFKARPPIKPDHLQKLPARQFVPVYGSHGTYYVYADPESNLLYFGNEAAYERYKVKAAEARAEEAQQAVGHKWSAVDWEMYADEMGGGP
jgi:hypothetical protein